MNVYPILSLIDYLSCNYPCCPRIDRHHPREMTINYNFTLLFLYLGSDNAFDEEKLWRWGSCATFIEALIFTIVMLTLETDDLHTMRTHRTAYALACIMLFASVAKHYLYHYIEHKMEEPKETQASQHQHAR